MTRLIWIQVDSLIVPIQLGHTIDDLLAEIDIQDTIVLYSSKHFLRMIIFERLL